MLAAPSLVTLLTLPGRAGRTRCRHGRAGRSRCRHGRAGRARCRYGRAGRARCRHGRAGRARRRHGRAGRIGGASLPLALSFAASSTPTDSAPSVSTRRHG